MRLVKLKGEAKVRFANRVIDRSQGRFFTAGHGKVDGTPRTGQYRIRVKVHTKGVGAKYDARARGLRTVWEANNKAGCTGADAYRNLNLHTLFYLKVDEQEYKFIY